MKKTRGISSRFFQLVNTFFTHTKHCDNEREKRTHERVLFSHAVTTHPFGLLCATNQRLANRSHRRYDSFTTHAIQPSRGTGYLRPPVPVVADITLAFTASPIAKDNIVVQAAKVSSALRYLTR